MKALIIDDEINCREVIRSYIELYTAEITEIKEGDSISSAREQINAFKPDIVFLDIQLHDSISFDLLVELETIDFKIIFTTAYDNYAIKAFEYGAVHYLLKPLTPKKYKEAVERCFKESTSDQDGKLSMVKNFYLRTGNSTHNILFEEILYIEADGSYSTIYNKEGRDVFTSKKLADYKEILPDNFFRIHNSIIVNTVFVREINEKENLVHLTNGSVLPISRRKKKAFKIALTGIE